MKIVVEIPLDFVWEDYESPLHNVGRVFGEGRKIEANSYILRVFTIVYIVPI